MNGYFNPKISKTLISLIPKMGSPTSFKELRLISLCNVIYKIITKVIVGRLRTFPYSIIGPLQSSFVLGSGTFNNAIILQEVLHSMHCNKNKRKGILSSNSILKKHMIKLIGDFLECLS